MTQKPSKFKLDAEKLRLFAEGANAPLPPLGDTAALNEPGKDPLAKKPSARAAKAKISTGQGKVRVEAEKPVTARKRSAKKALPWEGVDDDVLKKQPYIVHFPASLHLKLAFLKENEPGGPSIHSMILAALTPYVEERLEKYTR